jgi:hypothetical protein
MAQLIIEKPCHEKWRNMSKHEEGRWCLSCNKTVVDFSGKSSAEIVDYLKSKNGEEVCGRGRADQVISPGKKPSRYRWLSILSFIFGITLLTSCYRKTQGCYAYNDAPQKGKKHKTEVKADTVSNWNRYP